MSNAARVVLDIPCKYEAEGVMREAAVETTITGVRWTLTGDLAAALQLLLSPPSKPRRMTMTLDKDGLQAAIEALSECVGTECLSVTAEEAIEAYLAHTRPLPADIAVKKLEWEWEEFRSVWKAPSILGEYTCWVIGEYGCFKREGERLGRQGGSDEATVKEAAQRMGVSVSYILAVAPELKTPAQIDFDAKEDEYLEPSGYTRGHLRRSHAKGESR